MLPDVQTKQRSAAVVHQRVVLVRGADDTEFAVFFDEPGPTGTEAGGGSLGEGFLEGVEAAESFIDGFGKISAGSAAGVGGEALPEEVVVPMTPTVVADGGTDVIGNFLKVGNQFVEAQSFQIGFAGDGVVEVGDVGVVMAVMVDLHRQSVDVRLQGVVRIRQRIEFECHGFVLFWLV